MRVMKEENLQRLQEYITGFVRQNNGTAPTLSDIMNYMGMVKSTAYRHILELEKRGIVSYTGKSTLKINLQDKMQCKFRRIPLLGKIICGNPDEQEEYTDGYFALPSEWIKGDCFLLEAYGDSMVDVGIEKGDLVLVRRVEEAFNGQIVAVLTEDGTTLKRYKTDENGKPWLLAENRTYPDEKRCLHPKSIVVQGLVLKIIKDVN